MPIRRPRVSGDQSAAEPRSADRSRSVATTSLLGDCVGDAVPAQSLVVRSRIPPLPMRTALARSAAMRANHRLVRGDAERDRLSRRLHFYEERSMQVEALAVVDERAEAVARRSPIETDLGRVLDRQDHAVGFG